MELEWREATHQLLQFAIFVSQIFKMAVLTRWAKSDFNLEEQDSERKARRQSRGRLIGRHTLANGKAFG